MQSQQATAEAWARASRIELMFEDRLRAKWASAEEASIPFGFATEGFSDLSDSYRQSIERESGFLAAFECLMQLCSEERIRQKVIKIFDNLKQIRLIDVGDDPAKFTIDVPGFELSSEPAAPDDRRREMLGSALDFQMRMREFMARRLAAYEEQIERSKALLNEALTVARILVS